MLNIGTQTFGIAKELSVDFSGTLRSLHDIGFDSVEPMVLFSGKQGKTPKNLWAQDTLEEALPVLEELGMGIPSIHIGIRLRLAEYANQYNRKKYPCHSATHWYKHLCDQWFV